ncbi:hypothetical protein G352_25462, partial [Rhodococcus ruber BKS 20-38]
MVLFSRFGGPESSVHRAKVDCMKDVSAIPSAARVAALLGELGADRGPLYRAVAAALRRRIA